MEGLETTEELQAKFVREVQFPPDAMAIKMFFYRLRDSNDEVHFPLWDWTKIKVRNSIGDGDPSGLVDLDESDLDDVCVKLEALGRCQVGQPVPIAAREHFYTVQVTEQNTALFSCSGGCDLQEGDLLILVALHIASKQTPEWLWATFWWRGGDDENLPDTYWTCPAADRPPSITGIWKNYSMDVTASFQLLKPKPDPRTGDADCGYPPALGGKPKDDLPKRAYLATYNPFSEALMGNGLNSSCVDCHARASTTNRPEDLLDVPDLDGTGPLLRDLEGDIRLDYLWSLNLRKRFAPTVWPKEG